MGRNTIGVPNHFAVRETEIDPNRQFAVTQHQACYGRRTGLSVDAADTAGPDPKRSLGSSRWWATVRKLWAAPKPQTAQSKRGIVPVAREHTPGGPINGEGALSDFVSQLDSSTVGHRSTANRAGPNDAFR
jgi:hypothetical protein